MKGTQSNDQSMHSLMRVVITVVVIVLISIGGIACVLMLGPNKFLSLAKQDKRVVKDELWKAPDIRTIPNTEEGELIKYGKDLISFTSKYLGPKGIVMSLSNGMNCQNCHLDAGTKPFGNNYSAVASTYPLFRARSGTLETIEKRVNDCFERSLNGKALAHDSHEMKAMVAYIQWVGKDVPKGELPKGAGLVLLPFLNRPANPDNGKLVYDKTCTVCHGKNGEGMALTDSTGWLNPPLWGPNSYNSGAGLFRLSRFAGYVKANMPFGATYDAPQLTDEQAWDVAAYVNSLPRPSKDLTADWPDISKKPIDHPFGPYADEFSEQQHKFGPFKPIEEKKKLTSPK
ncbi:MAG: c-type cytochrome [Cyclobacteriaceae bacterium]|nr:c-type cytochrome [Cyclobacteriaceae bacterium]